MTLIKRCDGCKSEIKAADEAVRVERDTESAWFTAILPADGRPFHWCRECALFAINALRRRSA